MGGLVDISADLDLAALYDWQTIPVQPSTESEADYLARLYSGGR